MVVFHEERTMRAERDELLNIVTTIVGEPCYWGRFSHIDSLNVQVMFSIYANKDAVRTGTLSFMIYENYEGKFAWIFKTKRTKLLLVLGAQGAVDAMASRTLAHAGDPWAGAVNAEAQFDDDGLPYRGTLTFRLRAETSVPAHGVFMGSPHELPRGR